MQWHYISDWSHLSEARPADPNILPKLDAASGDIPHCLGEIDQAFIAEAVAERFGVSYVQNDLVPHLVLNDRPFYHCYNTVDIFDTLPGAQPAQRVWANRMPKIDGSDDIWKADSPITDFEIFRISLDTTRQEMLDAASYGPMIGSYPRHLYKDLAKFEKKAETATTDLEYSPTNVVHFNSGGNWQMLNVLFFQGVIESDTPGVYEWMRTGQNIQSMTIPSNSYLDAGKSMNSPRNLLWSNAFPAPKFKSIVAEIFWDVTIQQIRPDDDRDPQSFTRVGFGRQYVDATYDQNTQRVGISGSTNIGRAACVQAVEKIFPGWGQLFAGQGEAPPEYYYRRCVCSAGYTRVFFELDLETTLSQWF